MNFQNKKEKFMDMYDDSIHSGCALFMYQTEEKVKDIYLPFVECHIISRDDMRRRREYFVKEYDDNMVLKSNKNISIVDYNCSDSVSECYITMGNNKLIPWLTKSGYINYLMDLESILSHYNKNSDNNFHEYINHNLKELSLEYGVPDEISKSILNRIIGIRSERDWHNKHLYNKMSLVDDLYDDFGFDIDPNDELLGEKYQQLIESYFDELAVSLMEIDMENIELFHVAEKYNEQRYELMNGRENE